MEREWELKLGEEDAILAAIRYLDPDLAGVTTNGDRTALVICCCVAILLFGCLGLLLLGWPLS